jgi:predicted transcriptional regulator
MANVTVAVPDELKKRMEHVPDVNWSEVARQAFEETIRRKQMREAAESTDRLRESSKTTGWSGAAEIRKWRDRDQRSKS